MDTLTLRILDTLSSSLGDSPSINQLTQRIKETHGTAHYPNIYQKLQNLKKEGFINLNPIGRSSVVKLNFQNYLLTDFLAEMEIEKKREFLKNRNDLSTVLTELEETLNKTSTTKSVCFINPTKNIKLNRIELLFLLRHATYFHDETIELFKETQNLQNRHNLRIDSLILNENGFSTLLKSDEINPLREALTNKIALFGPQMLWNEIKATAQKTEIKTLETETKPADIPDSEIIYNLDRFGYKEFGTNTQQGKKFCIEYLATALMLQGDARRIDAIPVVLAKNAFRSNLLAFLSQKYGTAGKLLGLLRTLDRIKPSKENAETMTILQTLNTEEIPADEKTIQREMRLYNVA